MSSTFRTFGPFALPPQIGAGRSLIETWRNNRDLRYGIGIYIVAEKKGDTYIPWYVGKSDRSFGSRLQNHSVFKSLPDHLADKSVYLFLIARVTTKQQTIIRSKAKYVVHTEDDTKVERKKLTSISRLEYELIGACRAINNDLLNFQLKKFQEGLRVPGYTDNEGERDDSAVALGKMLRTTRSKR